jgi:hypothetical protein
VTTEFVLLLGLYAFILLGVFLGPRGPVKTFNSSAPRLAAKLEKDISIGKGFIDKTNGAPIINWKDPDKKVGP